ncbi:MULTISPECIES: iron ABC transporter permease [unclassified Paenibacillus]|uniref:FecCD family ABC transporter permease n=1 Tax=unclassified Paenibacillus TaxID=185978 RepID=UPI00277E3418|nr:MULTISPECIES: iron chelate uptake ABC transporter family permease subunit [unclassified Paenibacillus]MDQ0896664.1 iron complex transport system permease protein [Paenibacillus sp. V4I7]MDQ0917229.1 iron complex transport system permease protein [Paenibacillus sp. V4I5]
MKRKLMLWGGVGVILLLLSIMASLSLGTANLPVLQIASILAKHIPWLGDHIDATWPQSSEQIINKVRFPRVLLGILVGASLSIAGAAFQGVLRNPLADPYALGVSSGASVGAAFLIYFGLQVAWFGQWSIPIVAFVTGLISLFLVLKLAQIEGKLKMETLILSGVVMQAFLGAIVSFMVSISNQVINEIIFWLMGSLAMRGWSYTYIISPYLIIGFVVLLSYARSLNLLALGERQASHLGVNVERTKLIVLIVATFITAAAVSVAGVIGFVGLIVPHLVRLLVGPDYRLIIPLSAIGGGIYVLWADTLARTLLSPTEIPLGVITAFLGAPFFAYLLHKDKKTLRG